MYALFDLALLMLNADRDKEPCDTIRASLSCKTWIFLFKRWFKFIHYDFSWLRRVSYKRFWRQLLDNVNKKLRTNMGSEPEFANVENRSKESVPLGWESIPGLLNSLYKYGLWARLCKLLRTPWIDSKELIPPAYVGLTYRPAIPFLCPPSYIGWRNRFLRINSWAP